MTTTLHPTSAGPHAVVVGAGPTGLAFADTLGRRLERVTLIERHDIPDHGAPGDRAAPDPPAAAVRRVLHAPRIVVRPGLEVVGLVFRPGRVLGVEVVARRGGGRVTILADLVVDATGWHHDPAIHRPDGLILVGRAMGAGDGRGRATRDVDGDGDGDGTVAGPATGASEGRPAGAGRRRAMVRAESAAATLGRCLDEHLARHAGLAGFSALAEQALAEQLLSAVAGPPTAHGGSGVAVPAGTP